MPRHFLYLYLFDADEVFQSSPLQFSFIPQKFQDLSYLGTMIWYAPNLKNLFYKKLR